MSKAIASAKTIAEVTIETADRTRSEAAIKTAIRQLKADNGFAGKRLPVVYSSEFPYVSCPERVFVFVNDFGNGPKGQYCIEIKQGSGS